MAEKSIVFDLVRSPTFFDNWNVANRIPSSEMDGSTKNFEFVLASDCSTTFSTNVNNGILRESGTNAITKINISTNGQIALKYTDIGNGNRSVSFPSSTSTINLNNAKLKGLFLVHKTSRYVIAYTIYDTAVPIDKIKFPASGVIWTLRSDVSGN